MIPRCRFSSLCLAAGLLMGPFTQACSQSSGAESSAGATEPGRALDELAGGDQLWDLTPDQFEAKFKPLRFDWLSASKEQARFFGSSYVLWGPQLRVPEAVAEFQTGKLARVNFSIFNRGDSSSLAGNREQFEKQVEDTKTFISSKLGVQPVERGKDSQSAVKAMGWMWMKPPTAYLLEYSYQKEMKSRGQEFRPEFIRLRVAEVPKQQGLLVNGSTGAAGVTRSSLAANITRETTGDVVIKNVPMVDQGPKGYCAVATTERVFRYYGIPVDQHEMAQVANTGQGGGTSPSEMLEALEKLEARLRVRVRALEKWDYKEFSNMISDYNREAKRRDKREINLNNMAVINIGDIYASMDADSLKVSRTEKNKAGYSKFQRAVTDTIEKGVPLMWGVQLGLYKEPGIPQSFGGHMRLIIGYNAKTSEILYSDSWGAEHALKRMPMDNACAMTTGLYYIEPMAK
ncbi:C39 family peptidase [Verrucomicrobium sp. BvORR034]|uniref:C39 family peptidase n=1 Tax=Verrucomicrobium sp. BvORR034 TaxID=1396418 RepID=UPI0009DD781F|nr:C39 family peptidase [Verrucomicrobium sp. BvORR034]